MVGSAYALVKARSATSSARHASRLLPVLRATSLPEEAGLDTREVQQQWRRTLRQQSQRHRLHWSYLASREWFKLPWPPRGRSPNGLSTQSANALWGAHCGKSARWVLSGGTSTRGQAHSVRALARKSQKQRGSAKGYRFEARPYPPAGPSSNQTPMRLDGGGFDSSECGHHLGRN